MVLCAAGSVTLQCGDVELGMAQDQAAFVLAVDAGTQADGSGSLFTAASGIDGADQMTHQLNGYGATLMPCGQRALLLGRC